MTAPVFSKPSLSAATFFWMSLVPPHRPLPAGGIVSLSLPQLQPLLSCPLQAHRIVASALQG